MPTSHTRPQTSQGSDSDSSDAERQVRNDLAAAYRLVALYGMDDSIYTHISARVPGQLDQFLRIQRRTLQRDPFRLHPCVAVLCHHLAQRRLLMRSVVAIEQMA